MGDVNKEYELKVYELGTFLNSLDPLDPSKSKKYYSNESYDKVGDPIGLIDFKPDVTDTVLYVNRYFLGTGVNDRDTIVKANTVPSIKIPLDTTFFRNRFVDMQDTGIFSSSDAFLDYFRGIYIEPEGDDGSLMLLKMTDATLNIYYTNSIETVESTTDLNGDGDTDDIVMVRTKQTKSYALSGVRANKYIRDYTGSDALSYFNPVDTVNGQEKLFVQGAAGSEAIIEIFKDTTVLKNIREKNWLVNGAFIDLYLDGDQDILPNQLFLYNYDEKMQVLDAYTETDGIYGFLARDGDGNLLEPLRYEFTITNYMSELLKPESEDPVALHKFGVRVLHSLDQITQTSTTLRVFDRSWIAKGAVLFGNNIIEGQSNFDKRVKLRIYYTENNQN